MVDPMEAALPALASTSEDDHAPIREWILLLGVKDRSYWGLGDTEVSGSVICTG